MSSRRSPSPPKYPKSRTRPSSTRQMTATQRLPGASHILPPLFEPRSVPTRGPPAYLEPQSQYSPAPLDTIPNPHHQHLPFHPQRRHSPPASESQRRQRPAAAPLGRLLHPVPDTPPLPNTSYHPGYSQRQDRGLDPPLGSRLGGPQPEHGGHSENWEVSQQYPARDRYIHEAEPSYSPSYAGHGSSEGSRHGSTNSSGSYSTDRDQYVQSDIPSASVGSM